MKLNKKIIILALIFVIVSSSFVSAGFWDWMNKISGRATDANTKCYSDKDCSDLMCTAIPGQNTPKCNVNTGECYCGGVCGDGYCDSYEKSYSTCSKDCPTSICSDGTEYGKCSSTKPRYCSKSSTGSYILTDNCSLCECPSNGVCQNEGSCLICTDQYDPVCSADGKTYSNDCYAQNANVAIACEGTCPCETKKCSDGTEYGKCSKTQPLLCNENKLTNKCSTCGCPAGEICQSDSSCKKEVVVEKEIPISTITLTLGYNWIGLPVSPTTSYTAQTMGGEINSQGGDCDSVQRWDGSGWETYLIKKQVGTNFDVDLSKGYSVYCNKNSIWEISGVEITQPVPINLYAGNNFISIPYGGPYTVETMLADINSQEGDCNEIKIISGSEPIPASGNLGIEKDKAYMVYCNKASIWTPRLVEEGYSESFEINFGGWTADHYLRCEFDKLPCWPLEWDITRSTEQAYEGIYSLRGYLNGDHDDGTIWVERTFEASPNSNIDIEISFYLWSESYTEMNRWPVLAYVGLNNPEEEIDFNIIGETDEVAGWKKYSYSTQLKTDSKGILWIAFGFGATWETQKTYHMDLVSIRIEETGKEIGIESVRCDAGCLDKNNNCLPIGTRTSTQYCDIDKKLKNQLSGDSSCNNNYECKTNFCLEGKCTEQGFFIKIISWFKKLFG